uniref:(California timema) hypothetical protein n=1 Tax=Timema californicum TaxID=61474 RepID=A0A7R9J9C2_TIMCA|nr:unnamed protein product [Timema californicum]
MLYVRTIDCKRTETLNVSKKSTVNALKVLVEKSFGIKREKQRLFFSGKQLEGSYQLCDFNINLNDVVQVMEKQVVDPSSSVTLDTDSAEGTNKSEDKIEWIPAESKYYTVGDLVDVKETDRGSWVEASILNIYKDPQYLLEETPSNDGRIYCVRRLIVDEIVDCFVSLGEIRPRARTVLKFEDLHVGDKVMVNYNEEDPKARGHWFDLTVQHLDIVKKKKVVSGTLHFTRESYLNNITITFTDEIMRIEENKLREEMTEEEKELMHTHIDFRE